MIAFIVLFLPAILSVWIWEAVNKTALPRRNWVYVFALHNVLINLVCFAVKKWILHTADAPIFSFAADMTPSIACNYLIMALPLAVVFPLVPVVLRYLRAHIRFRLEPINAPMEDKDEKQISP